MNVLFIGAHPDDCEYYCAGTLARYALRGDKVTIAIATNGNIGSMRMDTKDAVAAMRLEEAKNSCAVIGAELIWMDFEDEYLLDTVETRNTFIDAVRQAKPDVMFTTWAMEDYNPDHNMTGYLAFIARINASIKLIKTAHEPTKKIPPMFYCPPTGTNNFIPEYYVDISSTIDKKMAMWDAHKSQNEEWLSDAFGVNVRQGLIRTCEHFAYQTGSGILFAEAFRLCRTWPIGAAEPHKLLP